MSVVELYFKILSNRKSAREGADKHSGSHDNESNFQKVTKIVKEDIETDKKAFGSAAEPVGQGQKKEQSQKTGHYSVDNTNNHERPSDVSGWSAH